MNCVKVLEYDVSWTDRDSTWEAILQRSESPQTCLIFACMEVVANMPDTLQSRILQKFHFNPLLMSKVCLELNGFSGCQSIHDNNGAITHHSHWSRFVVKQAHDTLQPKRTFNRQNSALKSTELYDSGPRRPYVPVHNHTSTRYGWTWYEMGFFVHWTPPNSTTVICFDLPKHLQASIRLALARVTDDIDFGDPYAVLAVLLNEVLCLYDDSVWSLRNHISNWEVHRQEEPDYALLHEIARHAIHVSETLTVTFQSITNLQQQHHALMAKHFSSNSNWHRVQSHLLFQLNILDNLLSRSKSNSARVRNEMSLAFHAASQRDSNIQVCIGQEARKETAAMKTIAIVTMTFLPATFVSSVFSMSFFHFEPTDGSATASFTVSNHFWMYWALAIPLSVVTLGLWFFWDGVVSKNYRKAVRLRVS